MGLGRSGRAAGGVREEICQGRQSTPAIADVPDLGPVCAHHGDSWRVVLHSRLDILDQWVRHVAEFNVALIENQHGPWIDRVALIGSHAQMVARLESRDCIARSFPAVLHSVHQEGAGGPSVVGDDRFRNDLDRNARAIPDPYRA